MMIDHLVGKRPIIVTLDVNEFLLTALQQLVDVGMTTVEINCTEQELLQHVLQKFPLLRIGAGQVSTVQEMEDCIKAGVHFITSPGFLPELAQMASIYSVNYLPGVATPSEAMQAHASGCQVVRPFPATPKFCHILHRCFPLMHLVPAEISLDEADHFFNLPSVVGVSLLNPDVRTLSRYDELFKVSTR